MQLDGLSDRGCWFLFWIGFIRIFQLQKSVTHYITCDIIIVHIIIKMHKGNIMREAFDNDCNAMYRWFRSECCV